MKSTIAAMTALILLCGCMQAGAGETAAAPDQAMIDRMAITDLLNRYYAEFGAESSIGFNQ